MDSQLMSSPLGNILIKASAKGVTSVELLKSGQEKNKPLASSNPHLELASLQLKQYFEGQRKKFDVPLDLDGTEFQKKVWKQLTKIPFGRTQSYSEIALKVGRPKACRAVGGANHVNPIAIIVPCHRVIGHSGDLTGYASGLKHKKFLLKLEGALS